MSTKSAVILLSGGLDSATTLAIAKDQGYDCYALTFQYGQRHACELEAARRVAKAFKVREHRLITIDLAAFGGSALTNPTLAVPTGRNDLSLEIPITYVPVRNTVFLSYALVWAEVLGLWDIFIGVNAVDYSGYPDCRPAFIAAFEKMANLAAAKAVQGQGTYHIHTPIIEMTKAQIIRRGVELGVDYALTHSCYDPDAEGRACGRCDACRFRLKGFAEAGLRDPVDYAGKL
ncbi:MAG: 7-cyano-7-deazaguanine synthase QueC [Planctomycetes bacterium]|jgi:7-cyano-7-deazaguanine synthase|nr:7-cyano-7-deazaguanine synthase QueC [Planctomycetota bacterium]